MGVPINIQIFKVWMVPGPRFELGTTNKNNEKTLFMPCDKGQMSKYGA